MPYSWNRIRGNHPPACPCTTCESRNPLSGGADPHRPHRKVFIRKYLLFTFVGLTLLTCIAIGSWHSFHNPYGPEPPRGVAVQLVESGIDLVSASGFVLLGFALLLWFVSLAGVMFADEPDTPDWLMNTLWAIYLVIGVTTVWLFAAL